MLRELLLACHFLTRLPLPAAPIAGMAELAPAVWAFAPAGALVGILGGLAYALAIWLGLTPLLAGLAAVLLAIAVTGALHEDGLADSADALGAGPDRERALAIMKDSRIGTFGTVALLASLLGRAAALAALHGPWRVVTTLIAAEAFARAVLPLVMLWQQPARPDGLAAALGRPEPQRAWLAPAIAVLLAAALLAPGPALRGLLAGCLLGGVVMLGLGSRFAGYTGDTLGAVAQAALLGFLLGAAARP